MIDKEGFDEEQFRAAMAAVKGKLLEALQRVDAFSGLSPEQLRTLRLSQQGMAAVEVELRHEAAAQNFERCIELREVHQTVGLVKFQLGRPN